MVLLIDSKEQDTQTRNQMVDLGAGGTLTRVSHGLLLHQRSIIRGDATPSPQVSHLGSVFPVCSFFCFFVFKFSCGITDKKKSAHV